MLTGDSHRNRVWVGVDGIHISAVLVTYECLVLLGRNQMISLNFVFIRTFTRHAWGFRCVVVESVLEMCAACICALCSPSS